MKQFRRIGVLTSGGDAPGMNAAVRAVAREALSRGVEVMGIMRGYSGLIDGDVRPFTVRDVSNILNRGGTVLYSDRCPEFKTEAGIQKAVETCRKFLIDGIVAIGGDGTFRGAQDMTHAGIPCIGIPATIDNDITSTEYTIGFDTAMNTTLELVDKLRDTCESHARCNVVEVMGRGAGDIALQTAVAAGATAVAIPELPFDEHAAIAKIRAARALGKRAFIVVVSEGMGAEFAAQFAARIEKEAEVETRFARFAHIARGGVPTLRDRLLATRMGQRAVEELFLGNSNLVLCERAGVIRTADIHYALTLDRLYKGKATAEELALYTKAEQEEMKAVGDKKRALFASLYHCVEKISL